MATEANINWKPTGNEKVQEGFVGDQTNKAFTLTDAGGKFILATEITGEENQGGTFDSEAEAKTHADFLIETHEIPKFGSESVEMVKNAANQAMLSSN